MFGSPETFLWLLVECFICLLLLAAGMVLFCKRRLFSWLMLVGSVLMLWTTLIRFMPHAFTKHLWTSPAELVQGLMFLTAMGPGILFVGFLLYALEERARRHRIMELEILAADQQEQLAMRQERLR